MSNINILTTGNSDFVSFAEDTVDNAVAAVPGNTTFVIRAANLDFIRFEGSGFTYSGATPVRGNVTRVVFGTSQEDTVEFTGFSVSLSQAVAALQNSVDTFLALFGDIFFQGNLGNDIARTAGGNDTLQGSSLNDNLFGAAGTDTLDGGGGNDILNGGIGNDVLKGNFGDDIYYVDSVNDVIQEVSAGDGFDRVFSTAAAYTLSQFVENLNLQGTGNINGTGNGIANTITGNAGNNTLIGLGGNDILIGGLGTDKMFGGLDNDSYYVDSLSDVVTENVGQGTADRVLTSISYVLAAGAEIENLTTNNTAGVTAITLVGNGFAQTIQGNAGENLINGGGGKDIMRGMGGNDRYYVDSVDDVVVEAVGGGNDRVQTSISYILAAGQEIELFTTTNASLNTALNLTGNSYGQTIEGNAGANIINGGLGNDVLRGFGGQDAFLFNTLLGATNVDRILDFVVVDDTIRLENAIFNQIAGVGVLTGPQFAANLTGAATDDFDRIIYETDTGKLFYDADGLGGANGVQFALLAPNLALTNADFFVV